MFAMTPTGVVEVDGGGDSVQKDHRAWVPLVGAFFGIMAGLSVKANSYCYYVMYMQIVLAGNIWLP